MNPMTRGLVLTSIVTGALMGAVVLLWIFEVIAMPLFLGAVVVIAIGQMGLTMWQLNKMKRGPQSGRTELPGTTGDRGEGFDPMDRYR